MAAKQSHGTKQQSRLNEFKAGLERSRDWLHVSSVVDWLLRLGFKVPADQTTTAEQDELRADILNALWVACRDGIIRARGWTLSADDMNLSSELEYRYHKILESTISSKEQNQDILKFSESYFNEGKFAEIGAEWFQVGYDEQFLNGIITHPSLASFIFLLELRWPDVCHAFPKIAQENQIPAIPEPGKTTQRGAPLKYEWPEFWVELVYLIHQEGWPKTQAELERKMLSWCGETWGEEPALNSVKPRIAKAWKRWAEANK